MEKDIWTIQRILEWTTDYFKKGGLETPKLDAELILAHVLKVPRIQLIIDAARPLTSPEIAEFKALILRRRRSRDPMAYILGKREFWSLPLSVAPCVLIPRPDTECLVERVLEFIEASKKNTLPSWLKPAVAEYSTEAIDGRRAYYEAIEAAEAAEAAQAAQTAETAQTTRETESEASDSDARAETPAPKHWNIADIGTGSGAIALALASELPAQTRRIIATDISPMALDVARTNAQNLELEENVDFVCDDLLNTFSKIIDLGVEKFDIIASNPPYISTSEMRDLPPEVHREPTLALEAGSDGLDIYRKLVPQAHEHLVEGGLFIVEIGSKQGQSVAQLFTDAGFKNVRVLNDYANLPRNVVGIR